jgi:agmatine deiminase
MISDNQTNFLYLADTLPKLYPNFYHRFEKLLKQNDVNFKLLPETKDVWARDYMPIQIEHNKFVRFTYNPKYLRFKKYANTISNTDKICRDIKIETIKSELIIDGGNVTKCDDKIIMTDRIFTDNITTDRNKLLSELEKLFQTDKLFIIPSQPNDFTGHSDGMIRFIDNDTIIINDYSKENSKFRRSFETALNKTGLNQVTIPYCVYENASNSQANGDYINYLQMSNLIIVPTFNKSEDDIAVKKIKNAFNGIKIITIDSNEIANKGGVLNCISWNIKK